MQCFYSTHTVTLGMAFKASRGASVVDGLMGKMLIDSLSAEVIFHYISCCLAHSTQEKKFLLPQLRKIRLEAKAFIKLFLIKLPWFAHVEKGQRERVLCLGLHSNGLKTQIMRKLWMWGSSESLHLASKWLGVIFQKAKWSVRAMAGPRLFSRDPTCVLLLSLTFLCECVWVHAKECLLLSFVSFSVKAQREAALAPLPGW